MDAADTDTNAARAGGLLTAEGLAGGRLEPWEADALDAWLRPPEEATPRATGPAPPIARPAAAGRPPGPTPMRWVRAALVFDGRGAGGPSGVRGVGAAPARLLYRAGRAEIDLELAGGAEAGRLRLVGQVTAGDADPGRGRVIADGPAGRAEAEVDDLGMFVLDGLAAGAYRLTVGLTYDLIEIPALEL